MFVNMCIYIHTVFFAIECLTRMKNIGIDVVTFERLREKNMINTFSEKSDVSSWISNFSVLKEELMTISSMMQL